MWLGYSCVLQANSYFDVLGKIRIYSLKEEISISGSIIGIQKSLNLTIYL